MTKRVRTIAAGKFKARCLALLDEVAATHQPVIITKRGRPVARVLPIENAKPPSLLGSILEEHDLLSPIDERWDADR
ncbi:MAG: type II toxin-antitoxin system prevent-host-death family antitoxin [Planctomycetes bacterium]|nr:type II toxin-antitoxin system prevent-host-death family antitoxin [Planctomycetota bacterium]